MAISREQLASILSFHEPRIDLIAAETGAREGYVFERLALDLDGVGRVRAFLTRPAAAWEQLAYEAGAVLNVVRTPREWLVHEHARAMQAVAELDDPELGPTRMAGLPVRLLGSPGAVRGPRHRPDADRALSP